MKKLLFFILISVALLVNAYALAQSQNSHNGNNSAIAMQLPQSNDPNQLMLPNPFPVYMGANGVINHSAPGYSPLNLPTNNDFNGVPGCYVACYSHDAQHSIYPVGGDIYVNGQVRVAGSYVNGICIPTGYEGQDISKAGKFKKICGNKITSCAHGRCWAGGGTGGWFGIQ